MRKLLDLLVVGLAAGGLLVACDDGGGSDDPGADMGGAGAGGGGAGGGAGGEGGMGGGAGGEGGGAGGMGGGAGGEGGGAGGMGGAGGEVPMGDTDPAGPVNEYGPSGRVTFLDIPMAPAPGAGSNGCDLVGSGQGSNLGALALLVDGGLSSLVQPDDMGEIQFILLSQLEGWAEGQTGNQVGTATMNLFIGDQNADGTFSIDPDSFVGGDPANGALIAFADTSVSNSTILTPRQEISLELPIVPGIPLSVRLSDARFKSGLRIEADGFAASNGTLAGYFTKDAVLELITGIITFCADNMESSLCQTVAPILGNDVEAAYTTLTALVPPDVKFENGVASECQPADCNAIGVCLLVEMQAEVINGVSAAND